MMIEKVHVASFYKSLNKYGEELCGDQVEVRQNEDSFIMVLADGLGSGVKANILSTLTSTIISEMIKDGSSVKEVVETITATLPECKERHVAYSTFTILKVNYDGSAKLVEYDNPPAIIMRQGKALDIEREVYTLGSRTIKEANFEVLPKDIIIFFSDGIIHAGIGTVLNLGWDYKDVVAYLEEVLRPKDDERIVNHLLLRYVDDLYDHKPGDDSTVAVAKILEAKETRIMVGPPINKEDDEKVVHKLMTASGKKICCGGTTSNVVSRVINEPIEMDMLESLVGDVPPIAYIKGVDLVTEGVLTLGKVNEHLKECLKSLTYLENLLEGREKDGASLLCRILLKDSTKITFMVGLSDNPAHKAIAYSTISISAKLRLIENMAESLRKLGKIVLIEKY